MHPKGACIIRACTRGHRRCAHAWHTLRSHDFDTITCVRRFERAVMFFVHPSGAWISCTLRVQYVHTNVRTLRHAHLCAHVCTLSGTHMCERVHVHVSAPCGCVISFSKRTLRFAPRLVKPPEGWGPLRSQTLFNRPLRWCTSRARANSPRADWARKIAARSVEVVGGREI